MQRMLDLCTKVAMNLDLKYNIKKSMALRIGKRFKISCKKLLLDGKELNYVDEIKYLGIIIQAGSAFRCVYSQCKLKFYRSFNTIYSRSKSASSEIICINLLKFFCIPLLLYATEAITPSKSIVANFENMLNNCIGKIFGTYDKLILHDIRFNCAVDNLCSVITKRRCNFLLKYSRKNFYFVNAITSTYTNLFK